MTGAEHQANPADRPAAPDPGSDLGGSNLRAQKSGFDAVVTGDILRDARPYGDALLCFINHGTGIKTILYRLLARHTGTRYEIFVEGYYRKRRIEDFGVKGASEVHVVGYPKLDPIFQGKIDREIHLPVSQVTMCAFGGGDLQTLFITSARENLDAPPAVMTRTAIDRNQGTINLIMDGLTPYLDEAERCTRVVLMHEGRVLANERPIEIGLIALYVAAEIGVGAWLVEFLQAAKSQSLITSTLYQRILPFVWGPSPIKTLANSSLATLLST